jgi:hypothetical protein
MNDALLANNRRTISQISDSASEERAKAIIFRLLAVKRMQRDPSSCMQEPTTLPYSLPCSRTTAACGVNQITVFTFMVYKSAYPNALSALSSSSVDTSRSSSCRNSGCWPLKGSRRRRFPSSKSRYRVHGENRCSMIESRSSQFLMWSCKAQSVSSYFLFPACFHCRRGQSRFLMSDRRPHVYSRASQIRLQFPPTNGL